MLFGHFLVDPLDYPLLGYCWKHSLYFDLVLPMGLRWAAMACQRITNAVCYICEMAGHHTLSYLDDFIGVVTPDIAWQAYDYCGHLLPELGLEESLSKACPPATIQTCLGMQFDTVQMTVSVTLTRLTEIETLLVSSLRGGFTSCGPITAFRSFPHWSGLLPTPCSPLTHAYRDVVA